MKTITLKISIILISFVVSGAIAAKYLNTILSKRFGRIDLEQTAVFPSAWLPHKLNITYGKGGNPDTIKYYNTHNAQGFKYPRDISTKKPPKTIRIFAMGGSTLYGWGSEGLENYGNHKHLANDETITFFLESKLNKEIKKLYPEWNIEVINAGITDHNSAFHLVYYNQTIYKYHPDIILFLDGNNEFFGIKPWNTFAQYKNTGVNIVDSFNNRGKYFTMYVVTRYLAQFSSAFKIIQYKYLNKWLATEAPTVNKIYEIPNNFNNFDKNYDAKSKGFLRTYAQLKTAAKFDHAKVLLFLGPQLQLENVDLLSRKIKPL